MKPLGLTPHLMSVWAFAGRFDLATFLNFHRDGLGFEMVFGRVSICLLVEGTKARSFAGTMTF